MVSREHACKGGNVIFHLAKKTNSLARVGRGGRSQEGEGVEENWANDVVGLLILFAVATEEAWQLDSLMVSIRCGPRVGSTS